MTNETFEFRAGDVDKCDLIEAVMTLARIVQLQAYAMDYPPAARTSAQQILVAACDTAGASDDVGDFAKLIARFIAAPAFDLKNKRGRNPHLRLVK